MANKKLISNWRLGLTYSFGAGFIAGIIGRIVSYFIDVINRKSFLMSSSLAISPFNRWIILNVVGVLGFWFGIWVISLYLNRYYSIKSKKGVLRWGLGLYIIFYFVLVWLNLAVITTYPFLERGIMNFFGEAIVWLGVDLLMLYFLGMHYIKETEAGEEKLS
jgi:hypothetical protein